MALFSVREVARKTIDYSLILGKVITRINNLKLIPHNILILNDSSGLTLINDGLVNSTSSISIDYV